MIRFLESYFDSNDVMIAFCRKMKKDNFEEAFSLVMIIIFAVAVMAHSQNVHRYDKQISSLEISLGN